MAIPYGSATSGMKAREEIRKLLQHFGCDSVGFMDEFHTHTLILAFVWNGRQVQLRASAQGWANAWLRENPWRNTRHSSKADWEANALHQGMIAVNSILRDWIKGQITAMETGMLTFEHIFMPHMLMPNGKPLIEHALKLLPAPERET